MKNIVLFIFAVASSMNARSEPKDGVVWPLLTVTCNTSQSQLEIAVTYVDDIEGLHDPAHGRYDFGKIVHWEEIVGSTRPDYKTSVDTFRENCTLKGQEFQVVITGHLFAGSPMQDCGISASADIEIYRQGRRFLRKTLLDDCFEHEMPPIRSMVIDMKKRSFVVHREQYIGG
jgi:hypothetical protein